MFPVTDPVLVFAILAMGMLVAPLLSSRLHLPDLVILLVFGAVLGPHGFHVLERNLAVTMLGTVGLLYIMFLAGIEIDLYRFMRSYKGSILFGLLTFIIPQSFGTLAGLYILGMNWPSALLLASMFASHTLLAYPIASHLGIVRREPVVITVGATIITDTLALLVLALVADSARGMTLGPQLWITIILGMTTLTVLTWKGIPYSTRWFFQRVTEKSNAQFLFVIVMVCGCAYLSHFAKMEPIIGAFLAGAAFNRLIPENSPLMSRVTFAGNTLFIPFFLISVGMLVDISVIFSGLETWLVATTMVFMVVSTKYCAAYITRKILGYSQAAGNVMFGLSVVQAAATLAAVVVGFNLKIFNESILNGAIIMIMVTCPLGSWAVERYGRRMVAEAPVEVVPFDTEQRLLIPVAKPASATRLLDLAFLMRDTARPGGIYPLTIVHDQGNTDEAIALGEKLLGHCLAHAASADITVNPGLRVAVNISDGIANAARELRSSQVIIGWRGEQSASIRVFGTIMQNLVDICQSRLLFCRLVSPLNNTLRLLVPFPPLASHRREISLLIRDIKTLAHRISAELRIYALSNEAGTLQQLIEKTRPAWRLSVVHATNWKTLLQTFFSGIKVEDMILLPLDRRNGVIWTPALDHLPEVLAERYPEMNLMVAFPSLPGPVQETHPSIGEDDENFPILLPVDLGRNRSLEQAFDLMADRAFPENPTMAHEAFKYMLNSATSYPVELAPSTALLHARFGDIPKPLMMVCHASEGWPIPNLPSPPRFILVVLGSQSQPPSQHLKTLAIVARRVHTMSQNSEIPLVQNAEDFCALLRRNTT